MSDATVSPSVRPVSFRDFTRSAGVWLTVLLVGYMFFNTFRAISSPVAFAESFGVPLVSPQETTFVTVYAIRALFLALYGSALLIRRSYGGLALFAAVASVMPVGDALLVASSAGAVGTVVRHALIAVLLVVTAGLLYRRAQQLTT